MKRESRAITMKTALTSLANLCNENPMIPDEEITPGSGKTLREICADEIIKIAMSHNSNGEWVGSDIEKNNKSRRNLARGAAAAACISSGTPEVIEKLMSVSPPHKWSKTEIRFVINMDISIYRNAYCWFMVVMMLVNGKAKISEQEKEHICEGLDIWLRRVIFSLGSSEEKKKIWMQEPGEDPVTESQIQTRLANDLVTAMDFTPGVSNYNLMAACIQAANAKAVRESCTLLAKKDPKDQTEILSKMLYEALERFKSVKVMAAMVRGMHEAGGVVPNISMVSKNLKISDEQKILLDGSTGHTKMMALRHAISLTKWMDQKNLQ